ncbi:MAG: hypothetical protein ACLUDU_02640 [Butyricimonas faecihominis]
MIDEAQDMDKDEFALVKALMVLMKGCVLLRLAMIKIFTNSGID